MKTNDSFFKAVDGMTIRDYIAIQAMQALIGKIGNSITKEKYIEIAKGSYYFADALIRESENV